MSRARDVDHLRRFLRERTCLARSWTGKTGTFRISSRNCSHGIDTQLACLACPKIDVFAGQMPFFAHAPKIPSCAPWNLRPRQTDAFSGGCPSTWPGRYERVSA